MATYWRYFKGEGKFYVMSSIPSDRFYWVMEDVGMVAEGHTWHFITTMYGRKADFEAHCGFDRGPRHHSLLMWLMDQDRKFLERNGQTWPH
jgi:hypothetical protein